jgi:Phosphotransferase enzyme family
VTERLIDTYVSSVQALWPGTPEPRLHRSRGSGRSPAAGETELLVLPHADEPRLLVPAGNPTAAARAMLRFSAALSTRDTVKRLGVSGLLRSRAVGAFPDRISVSERAGSVRSYLEDVLGEPVDFSLGLGTARANRKAVLQVFDTRGRSLAFVKIADNAITEALVQAEAASLQHLAEADLPAQLEVPRLLHLGRWEGDTVIVMTALDTSFLQRPSRQFELPATEMAAFHSAFAEPAAPLAQTPLWRQLVETQASLQPSEASACLGEALDRLGRAAAERPLPLGGWHGDWTPWNMSRRRGRLQLWDWERFETGVPLGLDRCHYGINTVVRRDGLEHASVMRGLELAGVSNTPGSEDHLVAAAYLATITCRYLRGAESHLGAMISQRSQVMLDALSSWLGLPTGVRRG